ncbi:MAG: hypothetical protein RR929_03015 [Erysipelotrichaceae bacterium]
MNKENKILIKRSIILIIFGIAIIIAPIGIAVRDGLDLANIIFIVFGAFIMLGGFSVLLNIIQDVYKERKSKNEL